MDHFTQLGSSSGTVQYVLFGSWVASNRNSTTIQLLAIRGILQYSFFDFRTCHLVVLATSFILTCRSAVEVTKLKGKPHCGLAAPRLGRTLLWLWLPYDCRPRPSPWPCSAVEAIVIVFLGFHSNNIEHKLFIVIVYRVNRITMVSWVIVVACSTIYHLRFFTLDLKLENR